jgi:hypothetical protein
LGLVLDPHNILMDLWVCLVVRVFLVVVELLVFPSFLFVRARGFLLLDPPDYGSAALVAIDKLINLLCQQFTCFFPILVARPRGL